jgi:hypothetical protein
VIIVRYVSADRRFLEIAGGGTQAAPCGLCTAITDHEVEHAGQRHGSAADPHLRSAEREDPIYRVFMVGLAAMDTRNICHQPLESQ